MEKADGSHNSTNRKETAIIGSFLKFSLPVAEAHSIPILAVFANPANAESNPKLPFLIIRRFYIA